MLKQLTISTKKTRTLKAQFKRVSIKPLNAYKQPVNPILRAIKAIKELQATPPRLNTVDSSLIAGASDLTVAEAPNTNQRGRIVAMPRYFRE
jgi:hypothetical protein